MQNKGEDQFVLDGIYISESMKRILVVGSSGAGKSSFSKRLQEKLHLELIHLDQYYWKPGWVKPEHSEWDDTVKSLLQKDSWIMDGNYRSTLHLRIPAADTIIFLDFPRWICFYRIYKRRFTLNREDEIVGCLEKVGWDLVRWVLWRYPEEAKKDMLTLLEKAKGKKLLL